MAIEGLEGVEQTNGEGGRRSESCLPGQVGGVRNFDALALIQQEQGLTDQRVLELLGTQHGFCPRVVSAEAVFEEGGQAMHGKIAVLVDGAGEYRAPPLPKIGREIGATAEETDSERSA